MKGKIFLGGGGNAEKSAELDKIWAETIGERHGDVLYVPWAQKPENIDTAKAWFRDTYGPLVGGRAIDAADLHHNLTGLDKYVSVYIGGGNTNRLAERLSRNGAAENLKEYVTGGGVIYGGSAGAIILGRTTLTAPEVNNPVNADGLDLLDGHSVVCHFNEDSIVDQLHAPIIALPEDAGAIFDETGWQHVGDVTRIHKK